MRADEILALLPEAGLQLWMLADNGPDEGWYCVLHKRGSVPDKDREAGRAPTPAEALLAALAAWGIAVEDDGQSRDDLVGKWLSAALEDPNVCPEMKADIERWFAG